MYYNNDDSLPVWRANVDARALFDAHAHRPERAQAWLQYLGVSEHALAFERAVVMRGRFEGAILPTQTYTYTFTPMRTGVHTFVLPVLEDWRLVDFIAINRANPSMWGCATGAGHCIGKPTPSLPVRVYERPITWLLADCDGILP